MEFITSRDGTQIAFDRSGDGPPLVLVGGAFSYRRFPMLEKIAATLADDFTVVNYDRRGRGDSTDTAPYAVEREIEDLDALIDEVGGSAYVWGLSSGGVLALRAAAAGSNIKKLAIYQPPFVTDGGRTPPADLQQELDTLVAQDRRSDAVRAMMTKGMGAPGIVVGIMRLFPVWKQLTAVANTVGYDFRIMGATVGGAPLSHHEWSGVAVPTLVQSGGKSAQRVRTTAEDAAGALPEATHQSLPGQSHTVAPDVLAPALKAFFGV